MDKMREQFEAALSKHYRIDHAESFRAGDDYTIPSIQAPWLLWNSALASVSAGQEKPYAWATANDWGKEPLVTSTESVVSAWRADGREVTPLYERPAPAAPQQCANQLTPGGDPEPTNIGGKFYYTATQFQEYGAKCAEAARQVPAVAVKSWEERYADDRYARHDHKTKEFHMQHEIEDLRAALSAATTQGDKQ